MITTRIDCSRQFGAKPHNVKLSVVIVTYNTGKELFDCLDSLQRQSEKCFEIILVDNGNANLNQLEKYNVSYYHSKYNDGPSSSRNLGIKKASSSLVAFLDDDSIATESWVSNIVSSFKLPNLIGIRGRIYPKNPKYILNQLQSHYDLGDKPIEYYVDVEGNSAFQKSALLAVGGYSSLLFGHEGVELCYRLSIKYPNSRIIYVPNVVILHEYADGFIHLVRKALRHGYSRARFGSNNILIKDYQSQFIVPAKVNNTNLFIRAMRILLIGMNYIGGLGNIFQKQL